MKDIKKNLTIVLYFAVAPLVYSIRCIVGFIKEKEIIKDENWMV